MLINVFDPYLKRGNIRAELLLGPKAPSLKMLFFVFIFFVVELLIGSRPHDTFFVV